LGVAPAPVIGGIGVVACGCGRIVVACGGGGVVVVVLASVIPFSVHLSGGGESLTRKEGNDNDQGGESSRELHCVGCSENEKASQKLGGKKRKDSRRRVRTTK
jgi:hypothetical protein